MKINYLMNSIDNNICNYLWKNKIKETTMERIENILRNYYEINHNTNIINPVIKSEPNLCGFNSNSKFIITANDYIKRFMKHAKCEEICFIISVIYFERFIKKVDVKINGSVFHKLFAISIYLAIKMYDDKIYRDCFYASLFGMNKTEMTKLSFLFLEIIEYELFVKKDEYENKLFEMVLLSDENNLLKINV